MKEKLYKNIGVFQKVKDLRALFRPGEGLTAFLPSRVVTGPRPVQGASFSCSGPAQQSAAGAPFDPDVLRLWLVQAHEILSQHSQVSFCQADGRHSLSAQGHASDHSVSRDARGKSCAVGKCSHACEAGGKSPCDGLLVPLPPKSRGLQLHHVPDRRRRRVAACVPRPGHSAEFGEHAAVAACQTGVNLVENSRSGCVDSSLSIHVSSHARTCASLTVSSLACPAAAASVASPAVSCVRSYAEVASAACDDASALHVSSLCSCNSGGTGGLLPVQRSTSYCLDNSLSDTGRVKGPTGRRCTKGGVSGSTEDLRPVSEVEAGVNFRSAGGVRGQVAGSLPRRQPGTGTRQVRGGVVTPSLHPEVPGIQFVSPGRGLDIRQSMGWTKVCGTAQSGIWVLKGNARARMLPANLDYLRVGWRKQGTYETAWVTPGHDCLCSYAYGHGAAVRPQTNNAIWHCVIGLWCRVAPLLSPWCDRRELPTGVNLNRYSGPSSFVRWHSDNEPLFGPQNAPKLIVSVSLGNSVEFKVRRRGQGNVPSLITLDHGDLLVMDGLTQSEYVHCTASGLQGPRVNLTFRWVAQHIASCPLAGVMGCVLPSCVQGLAEPDSRGDWEKGNKWSSFWEFGPSFANLGVRPSGRHLD